MHTNQDFQNGSIELILAAERGHLLQLCNWLVGDKASAEDIVQETLLIAWQTIDHLREPARVRQWLEGIARNRCRQWLRDRGRQQKHLAPVSLSEQSEKDESSLIKLATFDIEIDLDRSELATLLDLALAQLPPLTRSVLVERFVHESPQAEIARQLKLTEGAVEQRIQRGKLLLHRLLTTDLRREAATFGLLTAANLWQKTTIWCPSCAQQRYHAILIAGENVSVRMCCAHCGANSGSDIAGLLDNVPGFRRTLTRMADWFHTYFQPGLVQQRVACVNCGHSALLHLTPNEAMPAIFAEMPPTTPGTYGFWAFCTRCQWSYQADLPAIALSTPAVQKFWRAHPRMIGLPEKLVEIDGKAGLWIRYQDVTSSAHIDLLFERSTLLLHTVDSG